MKLNTILNLAAVVALLSTGCVKADVIQDCINQATTADAMVYARDAGTPIENVKNYADNHYESRFHPMLHRIINTAYNDLSLTRKAAYNNELSYCMSKAPKQKVVDK